MPVLSRSQLRSTIRTTTRKYGAKRVRMFGSYARNEERNDSDIDLLLEMPKDSSLLDLVALKSDLEDTLGTKIDIVTYNSIKPALRDRIIHEAVAL